MGWITKLQRDGNTRDKNPGRFDAAISDAVAEMNRLGISPNIPHALRRRADEHEEEIHRASMAADDKVFYQALAAWRKCFLEGQNEN